MKKNRIVLLVMVIVCAGMVSVLGACNDGVCDSDETALSCPSDCDGDGDGVLNSIDNCPTIANSNQIDADNDHSGDACDANRYIVWYEFEDNLNDRSVENNDGTLGNSPEYGSSVLSGQAANFSGGGDFFNIPRNVDFNIPVGTVSFWIKPGLTNPARNHGILHFRNTTISNYMLFRWNGVSQALSLGFEVNDIATVGLSTPAGSVPVNVWTHVAITQDGTGIKIYLNGNDQTSGSLNSISDWFATHYYPTQDFRVGHYGSWASTWLKGSLDDLKITNFPRTVESIEAEVFPILPALVDTDRDGIVNSVDNCPVGVNPTQEDTDSDGIGDVCDAETCTDEVDNDGDGLTDCLDSDCNGVNSCEYGAELTCTDRFDNDGDMLIDCLDSDCNTISSCEYLVELTCTDTIDNDGDTSVDCADIDCQNIGSCEYGTELSCADTLDNDGDTSVDCADSDCSADASCDLCAGVTCTTPPTGDLSCQTGSCNSADGSCTYTPIVDGTGCGTDRECSAGSCVCIGGYHEENGICVVDDPCAGVTCGTNAECFEGSCECPSDYFGNPAVECMNADVDGSPGFSLGDVQKVILDIFTYVSGSNYNSATDYDNDNDNDILDVVKMIRGMKEAGP